MRPTNHSADVDYGPIRLNEWWPDHVVRVNVTAGLAAMGKEKTVIDPACGDGSVIRAIKKLKHFDQSVYGDVSSANIDHATVHNDQQGDIFHVGYAQNTLKTYSGELCILTEILEHVRDPLALLQAARECGSKTLIASSPLTPHGKWDDNQEHLWMFDKDEYMELLEKGGWKPNASIELWFGAYPYTFQIWRASVR